MTFGPNNPLSRDSDGDGIEDATENMLGSYNAFDAFSADPGGVNDFAMLSQQIQDSVQGAPGDDVISVPEETPGDPQ